MAQSISDTSSAFSLSAVASTLEHMRRTIRDNVSDATPLLSFLMGKVGRTRRARANFEDTDGLPGVIVGGRDIRVPVQLLLNSTVASYSGMDTLDITHQDTDRYALFPIRQVSGSVVITGRDQRANKGDAAIYSLLQSKIMNLQNSLRMNISEQCFSDGTGNGGKDIDGLAAVVGNSTLAGINPTTYAAWQPGGAAAGNLITTPSLRGGVDSTSRDFDSGTPIPMVGTSSMQLVYANISQGMDQPDLVLLPKWAWYQYSDALVQQVRYKDVDEANAGFETLMFNGAAVMWDHDCPNAVYQLNSRHIAFVRDSEGDFAWLGEGQTPVDQDVFVRNMIVEGNVVTDNRRFLGKTTTIT